MVISSLLSCVCLSIFASQYKTRVFDRKPGLPNPVAEVHKCIGSEFKFGICDCFGDCQVLWHTCCCYPTRLADTYATAGILSYWEIFRLAMGLLLLSFLISMFASQQIGSIAGNAIFALVFSRYRGNLRERLGGTGTTPMDFFCLWCCSGCAMVQEARQIDAAAGVHTSCCFNLQSRAALMAYPMTGQAVYVLNPVDQGQQRQLVLTEGQPLVPPQPHQALNQPDMEMTLVQGAVLQDGEAATSYTQMND